MQRKVYLICPVRGVTELEKAFLESYVNRQEERGIKVHYPPRDVNQEDPTGLRILTEHRKAMSEADVAHIYWNGKSSGSFFDLGMAFMAGIPVIVANPEMIPSQVPPLGDLEIFLLNLPQITKTSKESTTKVIEQTYARKLELNRLNLIEYNFRELNKDFLFDFGMAFMTQKPIILTNRAEVERQRTAHKSFQNVLLELDSMARAS